MDEMMVATGLGIGVLAVYAVVFALSVASYVLTSLAFYTLAKRRGVRAPGLAWVPIANYWLIGNLVNGIDARNGMQRKWNVTLLTLSLIAVAGVVIAYVSIIVAGVVYAISHADPSMEIILSLILPFYILLILAMIVAVALSICTAICIYKVFESTVPEKAVKYLLLYLMVPLAGGICLIKVRNQGYPYPAPSETFDPVIEE